MRYAAPLSPAPRIRAVRDIVCRPRAEVEVSPATAELYFADERWVDPINTQIRFAATTYNSDRGVTWQVLAPEGGPGAGTIDETGLYRSPVKGALASGSSDVVVATCRADPLRRAFAWVTLIGLGPLEPPVPRIDVWPPTATVYYQSGEDNQYISDSNKVRLFRAELFDSPGPGVVWQIDGVVQTGNQPWFLYTAPVSGGTAAVALTAQSQAAPATTTQVRIVLLNYFWPGL